MRLSPSCQTISIKRVDHPKKSFAFLAAWLGVFSSSLSFATGDHSASSATQPSLTDEAQASLLAPPLRDVRANEENLSELTTEALVARRGRAKKSDGRGGSAAPISLPSFEEIQKIIRDHDSPRLIQAVLKRFPTTEDQRNFLFKELTPGGPSLVHLVAQSRRFKILSWLRTFSAQSITVRDVQGANALHYLLAYAPFDAPGFQCFQYLLQNFPEMVLQPAQRLGGRNQIEPDVTPLHLISQLLDQRGSRSFAFLAFIYIQSKISVSEVLNVFTPEEFDLLNERYQKYAKESEKTNHFDEIFAREHERKHPKEEKTEVDHETAPPLRNETDKETPLSGEGKGTEGIHLLGWAIFDEPDHWTTRRGKFRAVLDHYRASVRSVDSNGLNLMHVLFLTFRLERTYRDSHLLFFDLMEAAPELLVQKVTGKISGLLPSGITPFGMFLKELKKLENEREIKKDWQGNAVKIAQIPQLEEILSFFEHRFPLLMPLYEGNAPLFFSRLLTTRSQKQLDLAKNLISQFQFDQTVWAEFRTQLDFYVRMLPSELRNPSSSDAMEAEGENQAAAPADSDLPGQKEYLQRVKEFVAELKDEREELQETSALERGYKRLKISPP